jgi:GcrA cell cycle regulator
MTATAWTEEKVRKLLELHALGYSASQIAAELGGCTRNAVIGKLHRRGLTKTRPPASERPKRERKKREQTEKPEPQFKTIRSAYRRANFGFMQPVEIRELITDLPAEEPTPGMVKLMDLRHHHCRWPIGEPTDPGFVFCGKRKVDGVSYCREHSRVAFRSAQ